MNCYHSYQDTIYLINEIDCRIYNSMVRFSSDVGTYRSYLGQSGSSVGVRRDPGLNFVEVGYFPLCTFDDRCSLCMIHEYGPTGVHSDFVLEHGP